MALSNPLEAFIWGAGGAQMTPEEIARQREIAGALLNQAGDTSPVGDWTQGAARVVNALGGVLKERRANQAEASNAAGSQSRIAALLGGMTGGGAAEFPAAPSAPGGVPVSSAPAGLPAGASDIRGGIEQTASALGIDPIDLATAISYETAGTFDPTKSGPTTQYGQHRGLIQFGEPQAKQYGVDWSNPVASQLGPDGAVAKYLRDTGVKPGMGLLDIYSAINAGGVGKYNASDANNGGAPGTVRDKVEKQMAAHRAKALAMFGDGQVASNDPQAAIAAALGAPQQAAPAMSAPQTIQDMPVAEAPQQMAQAAPAPQQGINPGMQAAIAQALSNPGASPQEKQIATILLQQQMQNADPGNQLDMEYKRAQINALQAKPDQMPDSVRALNIRAQQAGLQPGTKEYSEFMLAGGNKGVSVNVDTGTVPQGYQAVRDEQGRVVRYEPVPGGPADKSAVDAAKTENQATSSDIVIGAASKIRDMAKNNPTATGLAGAAASYIPTSDAAEVYRQIDVLKSNAKIENLQAMRAASPTGGALGAVSDKENEMLAAKAGALDPKSPHFQQQLDDYERTLLRTIHGRKVGDAIFDQSREANAGGQPDASQPPQPGAVMDGYRFKGGDPADQNNWELVQ